MLAINRAQAIQNAAMFSTEPQSKDSTQHSVQSDETSLGSVEISIDAARLERRLQESVPVNVIRVPRIEIENYQQPQREQFPSKWTARILKACSAGCFIMTIPATVGAIMMGPIGAIAPAACAIMGAMFWWYQRPSFMSINQSAHQVGNASSPPA